MSAANLHAVNDTPFGRNLQVAVLVMLDTGNVTKDFEPGGATGVHDTD